MRAYSKKEKRPMPTAKIRTRLCASCKKQQRTGNAYCKACDAKRKAEERGKLPLPETEEGKAVRNTTDSTFDFLDANPGSEATLQGVTITSNEGGTVSFPVNKLSREKRRKLDKIQRMLREGPYAPTVRQ
jgi:hypothetical protein